MNAPPSYQEMCKMIKVKNDQLEEAKTNEMVLIHNLQRITDASRVFQNAYLRISTENSILEEKIRKLEGKM
jgi:predicted nuclease with TOPRIM domain